jgi:arylsulfatase A-like enzyme
MRLNAVIMLAAGLAALQTLSAAPVSSREVRQSLPGKARPNLLFIMADDHGRQATSCYGGKLVKTPNIDRLAREGVRFTQAFACNSICSPSRATLLTGKYNHLCGVRRLSEAFDRSQQTFPRLLQASGYETAIIGKWHLATEPAGFNHYSVLPGQGRYYDPQFKESGQPWGADGNRGGVIKPGYVTDIITDAALEWLTNRAPGRPFCLMVHHKAPHSPHSPAPRHKDFFKDTVFPEPPNLLDEYEGRAPHPVAGQLAWSRLLQQDERPYAPIKQQFTGDRARDTRFMYQEYVRNYLRLVVAVDENVGRLLDYLDRSGLAANTVVIYTSDNGYFLGEHGLYNKMWMYEESLHLPLLIRMPSGQKALKPGSTCDELVGMFDIAPTLLDLAGVSVPSDVQGRSLRPLLAGDASGWREAFYYHYYGTMGAPREDNWIASHEILGVRTKSAKLVFYPTWKNGAFWEYFDLQSDPTEMSNRYQDPAYQKVVTRMKRDLLTLAREYKDTEVTDQLRAEASASR